MSADGDVRREACTYRTVGEVPLEARLFLPAGDQAPRAAIAYFHPGSWRAGGPALIHELRHLASRGMVAAAFGYRLLPDRRRKSATRVGYARRFDAATSIRDCVADAQAAIRWLRRRADVDVTRVVAAGYSSGAHLAAATALLPAVEPGRASCRPNALVLYGGVFDVRDAAELSPLRHVRPKAPPGLVLCGIRDPLAAGNRQFAQAMIDAGNRCDLAEFPGGHNTFASRFDNPVLTRSLARVDEFLVSLDYLDAVPDVVQRIADLATTLTTATGKQARSNAQPASRAPSR